MNDHPPARLPASAPPPVGSPAPAAPPWHALPPEAVLSRMGSDAKGLTEGKIPAAEIQEGQWRGDFDPSRIGPEEVDLLRTARQFRRRVEIAARDLDPSVLADYLRELSGAYQRYYEIGNRDASKRTLSEDDGLRRARLATASAVQQVLRNGFRLLGLSAPEQM